MEKKYYCPTCNGELEMLSGCGAVGYFCNHCKKLVSRKKMLSEPVDPSATADAPTSDSTEQQKPHE